MISLGHALMIQQSAQIMRSSIFDCSNYIMYFMTAHKSKSAWRTKEKNRYTVLKKALSITFLK